MKSILKLSKNNYRYSFSTVSFYKGCSNLCDYCCMNRMAGKFWKDHPIPVKKNENEMYIRFKNEVSQNLSSLQKYGIFFSLTTDPLLPETKELTYKASEYCIKNNIPFKWLTKCVKWSEDEFLNSIPVDKKHLAHVGFSLTGEDIHEKGAPSNLERVELLKKLYNSGFKTWISAEPIINTKSTKKILKKSANYAYMIRLEVLTPGKYTAKGLSTEYKKSDLVKLYKWISKYKNKMIYLGEYILQKSHLDKNSFPNNFSKTGDLITELKRKHQL